MNKNKIRWNKIKIDNKEKNEIKKEKISEKEKIIKKIETRIKR